jgi:hypothetical protein
MDELAQLRDAYARKGSEATYERIQELEHDLAIHEYTVTLNAPKVKRPGGRLVPEFDMEIDVATGRLRPLGAGDLPGQYRALHPVAPRVSTWHEPTLEQEDW